LQENTFPTSFLVFGRDHNILQSNIFSCDILNPSIDMESLKN